MVRPGGLWRSVEVTPVTGSTNADLLARAAGGEPEGAVLAAEQQSAGRGRLGRVWVSPPRAALTFSVLLRPALVPRARLGWLPLLAGVAVAAAVRDVAAVDAQLKWPNDVLGRPGKLAGILAEAAGDAVVVGIGVNVSTGPASSRRPVPARWPRPRCVWKGRRAWTGPGCWPGSWLAWNVGTGRGRRVLGDAERSGLRAEYTRLCATLGRRVRVELPGGRALDGLAAGVDADGRLLVSVPPEADLPVAAGDVVHLR